MRVAFHTLGCKLNQAETESLARRLINYGWVANNPESADVIVLNTCTVTGVADRKARQWVRHVRKQNPASVMVATGCYAHRAPHELMRTGAIDLILDNDQKDTLPETLMNRLSLRPAPGTDAAQTGCGSRGRAMVKVQDGCHGPCAYCIVPQVRHREYSRSADEVVNQIASLGEAGYREIVLTGTRPGSYAHGVTDLKRLIERLLHETSIERLRISSLQPREVTPDLLNLWRDRRLCHHFHLALQSGSDRTLGRMKRPYRRDDFVHTVSLIRERIDDAAITTDVMAGFPGESDADFAESYESCRSIGFAAIHVFPFSPRPGTSAAEMGHQVTDPTRYRRAQAMLGLAMEASHRFRAALLGKHETVLWEQESAPGSRLYQGLTGNYVRVYTSSQTPLANTLTEVRLTAHHRQGLWAQPVSSPSSSGPSSTRS